MLAAQLIRAQGIEVLGLFFETPFFQSPKAKKSAQIINLPVKVVDIAERHLATLINPKHGYGSHMNPCIDCHSLMIRAAGEMLVAEGASFIITGEVLGQRPMSQNKQSLHIVAKLSGYEDHILRPLSAKLLPPPLVIREGALDRDVLYDISGRVRQRQMQLSPPGEHGTR